MRPTVLACGPRAFLLEFDSLAEVVRADRVLDAHPWAASGRVTDLVPAARTILVVHDGSVSGTDLLTELGSAPSAEEHVDDGPLVEIPVRYDGPDLIAVADACGLSLEEVVRRHVATVYRCAFCGFMPGFAYLTGLDAALWLPRRATPRTRVPAGSVAIASEYSAVYPGESPGGWHLIGSTSVTLWDGSAEQPALVTPGTRVRFVER